MSLSPNLLVTEIYNKLFASETLKLHWWTFWKNYYCICILPKTEQNILELSQFNKLVLLLYN